MGRMECWNDGMLMKNWSDGVTWRLGARIIDNFLSIILKFPEGLL
jgi:hypothetical protein